VLLVGLPLLPELSELVSQGHIPGTSTSDRIGFLADRTTEKSSQLQKGHVDCSSFWGLTCKKHSVHMLAWQHFVVLMSEYIKKQIGHSFVAPLALSGVSSPFCRAAMRPSAINRRIALSSHLQVPYNLWQSNKIEEKRMK
jgi:hypothetical protein